MSYFRKHLGDDASTSAPSLPAAGTVVGAALVYHGYKRTGSIIWALLYGLAGKEMPAIAAPIAIAQGFGHKKPCP